MEPWAPTYTTENQPDIAKIRMFNRLIHGRCSSHRHVSFRGVSKTCNLGYPPAHQESPLRIIIFLLGDPELNLHLPRLHPGRVRRVPTFYPESPNTRMSRIDAARFLSTMIFGLAFGNHRVFCWGRDKKTTDWLPGGWPTTICESDFWICMFKCFEKRNENNISCKWWLDGDLPWCNL